LFLANRIFGSNIARNLDVQLLSGSVDELSNC